MQITSTICIVSTWTNCVHYRVQNMSASTITSNLQQKRKLDMLTHHKHTLKPQNKDVENYLLTIPQATLLPEISISFSLLFCFSLTANKTTYLHKDITNFYQDISYL